MATVYFATNRNPDDKEPPTGYGTSLHPTSPDYLRFGWATVSGKRITIKTAPEKVEVPEGSEQVLGSAKVFDELHKSMLAGHDTIIYIHGYNVDFKDAVKAAAEVEKLYGPAPGGKRRNVVLFTWPSNGSMLPIMAYKSDRSEARASGCAFARGLNKLIKLLIELRKDKKRVCNSRIHLMCHSMGNYVLRNGLQAVRKSGGLPRVFDEIFMFAADEDYDCFEHDHKLALLPELGHAVNIYYNTGDLALFTSDHTKGNPARLGMRGPRQPHTLPGTVHIIDCSPIVGGKVEHSYYLDDKRVVFDVNQVLAGKGPDLTRTRKYLASQNRYEMKRFTVGK